MPLSPPDSLTTRRLHLRMPRLDDAEDLFRNYAQDPEVTKYLIWRPHTDIALTREFLTGCLGSWSRGHEFSWVITEAGADRGMVALRPTGFKADVGYVLAQAYWNQELMTEAVQAVVDWALEETSIFRVWAVCDVENTASARVLEKVGMTREGTLRRWMVHPNRSNEPRDCHCYAKVR